MADTTNIKRILRIDPPIRTTLVASRLSSEHATANATTDSEETRDSQLEPQAPVQRGAQVVFSDEVPVQRTAYAVVVVEQQSASISGDAIAKWRRRKDVPGKAPRRAIVSEHVGLVNVAHV